MEGKLEWLEEGQSEVEGAEAGGGEPSVRFHKVEVFLLLFLFFVYLFQHQTKSGALIFSSGVSGRRGGRFSAQGMG